MSATRATHTLAKPTDFSDDKILAELHEKFGNPQITTGQMFRAAFALGASDKLLVKIGGSYLLRDRSMMLPKISELPCIHDLRRFNVPDGDIARFIAGLCCDSRYGELHSEACWGEEDVIGMFADKGSLAVLFNNMIHDDPTRHYTEERVAQVMARLKALGAAEAEVTRFLNEFQDAARRTLSCFTSRFQAEAVLLADDFQRSEFAAGMRSMSGWNVFVLGMSIARHAQGLFFEKQALQKAMRQRPEIAPLLFGALEAGHLAMNRSVMGDLDRSVFPRMIDSLAEVPLVRELFAECGYSIVPLVRDQYLGLSAKLEIDGRTCTFVHMGAAEEGDYVIVAHILTAVLRPMSSSGETLVFCATLPFAEQATDEAITSLT